MSTMFSVGDRVTWQEHLRSGARAWRTGTITGLSDDRASGTCSLATVTCDHGRTWRVETLELLAAPPAPLPPPPAPTPIERSAPVVIPDKREISLSLWMFAIACVVLGLLVRISISLESIADALKSPKPTAPVSSPKPTK